MNLEDCSDAPLSQKFQRLPTVHRKLGGDMEKILAYSPQFSSVQLLSHVTLCDLMNRSMPGLPVHHQLPEFTQTHIH